jgi:hypothetical protein
MTTLCRSLPLGVLLVLALPACGGQADHPDSSDHFPGDGSTGGGHDRRAGDLGGGDLASGDAAAEDGSTGDVPADTAPPSDGGPGNDLGGADGDEFLPWEGGPAYYQKWSRGPSSDPSFFPINVWLQSPSNADRYKAIGINTFIGLYDGPTDQQLSDLTTAGVPTLCDQADAWQTHLSDPIVVGWTQQDEPDNAQPDGMGGYGPCISPDTIVANYQTFTANDPDRPVFINFGQGAAYPDYIGRGSDCAGRVDMYPMYAAGADILSLDIYPVNNTDATTGGNLWFVAEGVDRLRMAASYQKAVWNWIETTAIDDPAHKPTPDQVKTEVWMSLVHGSRGIGYFAHVFSPTFIEAGLLADDQMAAAVGAINQQIHDLAPVINSPSLANGATVTSSNTNVPVDIMVKRQGTTLYVFAVAMRPDSTQASFTLRTIASGSAEVLGESRSVPVAGGTFADSFDPYAVHLYKITPAP